MTNEINHLLNPNILKPRMYSFEEVRDILYTVKSDLLKIADEGEYEDLRFSVESYFKKI